MTEPLIEILWFRLIYSEVPKIARLDQMEGDAAFYSYRLMVLLIFQNYMMLDIHKKADWTL